MAYQQNSITALADILPLVYSFAPTAGITVGGTSGAPTLTINGVAFLLSAVTSGSDQELRWTAQSAPTITSYAATRSPKLNGTTTPDVSVPSKVHFFAGVTPQPHFAIVIEYGYNSYRHLYLGMMEKPGSYSGGQVMSGNSQFASNSSANFPLSYRDNRHQYLFSGFQTFRGPTDAGGVMVDHANNPTKWRIFDCPTGTNPLDAMTGVEAFGGFSDDINDAYLARAFSTYAGVNILSDINLFAPSGSGASANFAPIGNPVAIRTINMAGIDPGTVLTIGSEHWYCFPAFSKTDGTTVGKSAAGWAAGETSYMVGYAYLAD